jgi:anti-sigma regulatory factor (Ser/Thr protein kinase)
MAEALNSGAGVPAFPPEPLTVTLPALPGSLAVVRARLREWLAQARLDPESCADVLLAVGEATANAVEHSVVGADRPVLMDVRATLCGNLLALTVSDNGRWKDNGSRRSDAESRAFRGHGMHLINALVDSVELTANADGTTVQMLKELP